MQCGMCDRTFTRTEHLKRHELTHSRNRNFYCHHCGKAFLRKDNLERHYLIHQKSGPNLLQRKARACMSCAAAKVRCSGGQPACTRCQSRGTLPCKYPYNSNIDTQYQDGDTGSTSEVHETESYNDLLAMNPATMNTNELPLNVINHSVMPATEGPVLDPLYYDMFDFNFNSDINWLSPDHFSPLESFHLSPMGDASFFFSTHPVGTQNISGPDVETGLDVVSTHQDNNQNTVEPEQMHTHNTSSVTALSESTFASTEEPEEGEYYVDGQAARLPRVKRRRLNVRIRSKDRANGRNAPFQLSSLNESYAHYSAKCQVTDNVYQSLSNNVEKACRSITSGSQATSPDSLATEIISKNVIERLVESYIESFHSILPIFHLGSFPKLSWQLVLVVACIGARYLKDKADDEAVTTLARSLDILIHHLFQTNDEPNISSLLGVIERTQLRLLCCILSLYTNPTKDTVNSNSTAVFPKSLVQFCNLSWNDESNRRSHEDIGQQWDEWKQEEVRRRTGYAIWLLDAMFAIHFQQKPQLTLLDAQPQLPCNEDLWSSTTSSTWEEIRKSTPEPGTLNDALHQLYVEKKLSRGLGEWSRVLVIHGFFRRMWETETYLEHPLSQWTPTAHATNEVDPVVQRKKLWLPSVALFSKWRNSTCDCLDILHWSANATIGAASGLEHPTVMHLHFARVVLLTPFKNIVSMAKCLAYPGNGQTTTTLSADVNIIRRWAVQDAYKARLAMIHAGVLFWHVRRYSASAFYEPASVALSTLALWAFSTFSSRPKHPAEGDNGTPRNTNGGLEENFYDIILLDRPTDDELVQQFIRHGDKMRANMNGIGDLYGDHASPRVLVEGRKLLLSITCWKDCERWIDLIDALISASERRGPLQ